MMKFKIHFVLALALSAGLPSLSQASGLDKELNLPEIGLSMKYPSSWTVIDSKTLAAATTLAAHAVDPADKTSADALKGLDAVAKNSGFTITKYSPLEATGANPSFLYAPMPIPPDAKFDTAPADKKMMVLKMVLAPMMLEAMRGSDGVQGLKVIEEPSIIDGDRGVWFTVQGTPVDALSKKAGLDKNQVIRVYMFLGKGNLSIVTINYPSDGSEKDAESLLWEMVGSLKL